MKITVSHKAFEDKPLPIAKITLKGDVDENLELAFKFTQNIMDSWSHPEFRDQDGDDSVEVLAPLKVGKDGKTFGHRSTSVGDIMIVEQNDKTEIFVVASVGFKKIDTLKMIELLSMSRDEGMLAMYKEAI